MDDTVKKKKKKNFFRHFNTIELLSIKVLKGVQDCISIYGHNKTSIVGKFASVYICKGIEMLEPALKLKFCWVRSQRRDLCYIIPTILSYIRYAGWSVVLGMINVDLVLKILSRAAYFQPY